MSRHGLTLTGFSTALFSTWYFVDDLALLLDCGDGACAGLLQKSRKVRTIAISHADRDHLAGLPQFLQVNVRHPGLPTVLYPRDCGSFPALERFLHRFDRFHLDAGEENRWMAIDASTSFELGKARSWLQPLENRHIATKKGEVKSLSYRVLREHHRLRKEFQGCSAAEIAAVRSSRGDDAVVEQDTETTLVYSADSPIESPEFWGPTRILIHESTFLHREDAVSRGNDLRHSALDEVLPMASELEPEALVLGHFSTRYTRREIQRAIERECRRCRPQFPVYAVFPGEVARDLLDSEPAWAC